VAALVHVIETHQTDEDVSTSQAIEGIVRLLHIISENDVNVLNFQEALLVVSALDDMVKIDSGAISKIVEHRGVWYIAKIFFKISYTRDSKGRPCISPPDEQLFACCGMAVLANMLGSCSPGWEQLSSEFREANGVALLLQLMQVPSKLKVNPYTSVGPIALTAMNIFASRCSENRMEIRTSIGIPELMKTFGRCNAAGHHVRVLRVISTIVSGDLDGKRVFCDAGGADFVVDFAVVSIRKLLNRRGSDTTALETALYLLCILVFDDTSRSIIVRKSEFIQSIFHILRLHNKHKELYSKCAKTASTLLHYFLGDTPDIAMWVLDKFWTSGNFGIFHEMEEPMSQRLTTSLVKVLDAFGCSCVTDSNILSFGTLLHMAKEIMRTSSGLAELPTFSPEQISVWEQRLCDAQRNVHAKRLLAEKGVNLDCLEFPNDYMCPITLEEIRDPVTASDGHTYEKYAIEKVLTSNDPRSPITKERLMPFIFSNFALRKRILSHYPDMLRVLDSFSVKGEVSGSKSHIRKRQRSTGLHMCKRSAPHDWPV
tara:strand:+ start:248 stop:1870 length:1623 start_codon:yes stop_codon:yes gene_type:complete